MTESYDSSLHNVTYLILYDLNMLGLVMKYKILRQSDPTLVVAIYHCVVAATTTLQNFAYALILEPSLLSTKTHLTLT